MSGDVLKKVERLLGKLERAFGRGWITPLAHDAGAPTPRLSTGLADLDQLLGGGVRVGQLLEVAGPAAGGKSTLAFKLLAASQANGGVVAIIDSERAVRTNYVVRAGVDVNRALVCRPRCAEQALELVEELVRGGTVSAVAIDSVTALLPREEAQGSLGDDPGPLHARLMSRALRRLNALAADHGVLIVLVNQQRERHGHGEPDDAPTGGHAIAYYASTRLALRREGPYGPSEAPEGEWIGVEVRKSRDVAPGRSARLRLAYGQGLRSGVAALTLPTDVCGLAPAAPVQAA